ncbi:MAG: ribonuclease III [Flavobacteriales bacterium]|nr:ribonuclease III [Flavobacteriales bacterium]
MKRLIGFYPGNTELYKLAFRNKSAPEHGNAKVTGNNERLEYLGDAVLGSVVAHYLFKRFPFEDEGFLTEMRSKIVNRAHLNKLAVKLGFNELIADSGENISRSVYGDAFEALIGAIYLDKGYKASNEFIVNRIFKFHVDMDELEMTEVNFKGKLIDWGQKERKDITFELVEEIGKGYGKKYKIAIMVEGENWGEAIDFSKKKSEQRAAEIALKAKGLLDVDKSDTNT